MPTLAEAAASAAPRWWEALGAQATYDALTAAIDSDQWGPHDACSLVACRAPLHPGPCKGWKHTLHLVSPGAFHALEKSRVDRLNAKRMAKIQQLKAEGKKVPPALLKPILPKTHPGTPPPGWHPGDLAPNQPAHLAEKLAGEPSSKVGQKAKAAAGGAHAAGESLAGEAVKAKVATPGKVSHGVAVKAEAEAVAPTKAAAKAAEEATPAYTAGQQAAVDLLKIKPLDLTVDDLKKGVLKPPIFKAMKPDDQKAILAHLQDAAENGADAKAVALAQLGHDILTGKTHVGSKEAEAASALAFGSDDKFMTKVGNFTTPELEALPHPYVYAFTTQVENLGVAGHPKAHEVWQQFAKAGIVMPSEEGKFSPPSAAPPIEAPEPVKPSAPGPMLLSAVHAEKAAQGGTAKVKLDAYQGLSKDGWHSLSPTTQAKIKNDLELMESKFADPKKVAATQAVADKIGGWAKPPSPSPAVTEVPLNPPAPPLHDDLDKAMGAAKSASITGAELYHQMVKLPVGIGDSLSPAEKALLIKSIDQKMTSGPAKVIKAHLGLTSTPKAPKSVPAAGSAEQALAVFHAIPKNDLAAKAKAYGIMGKPMFDLLPKDVHDQAITDLQVLSSTPYVSSEAKNSAKASLAILTGAQLDASDPSYAKIKKIHDDLTSVGFSEAIGGPAKPTAPAAPDVSKLLDTINTPGGLFLPKHEAIGKLSKEQFDALPLPAKASVAELTKAGVDFDASKGIATSQSQQNADKLFGGPAKIPQALLDHQALTDLIFPASSTAAITQPTATGLDLMAKVTPQEWGQFDPNMKAAVTDMLHQAAEGKGLAGPPGAVKAQKIMSDLGIPAAEGPGLTHESVATSVYQPSETILTHAVAAPVAKAWAIAAKSALTHGTANNYAAYQKLKAAVDADPDIMPLSKDAREKVGKLAAATARYEQSSKLLSKLQAAGLPWGEQNVKVGADAKAMKDAQAEFQSVHAQLDAKIQKVRAAAGLSKRNLPKWNAAAVAKDAAGNATYAASDKYVVGEHALPIPESASLLATVLGKHGFKSYHKASNAALPDNIGGSSTSAHTPKAHPKPLNAKKSAPAPKPSYSGGHGYSYPTPNPDGSLPGSVFISGHGAKTSNGGEIFHLKNAYVTTKPEAEKFKSTLAAAKAGDSAHAGNASIATMAPGAGKDAAQAYTGSSYTPMNAAAREFAQTGKWGTGHSAQQAKKLHEAFLHGDIPPLKSDVVVYRGFSSAPAIMGDGWGPNLAGLTFTNHAFSSTSTSFGTAKGFSGANGKSSVVMRIVIPKGTPSVSAKSGGHFSHENEFIVGPNTTYRVIADHGWDQGVRLVDVEIIPNGKSVTAALARRGSGIPPYTLAAAAAALG